MIISSIVTPPTATGLLNMTMVSLEEVRIFVFFDDRADFRKSCFHREPTGNGDNLRGCESAPVLA